MKIPEVSIKKGKTRSIERFHPWIFSGAIHHASDDLQDGDVVRVMNHEGNCLGRGLYSNGSIAVRMLTFTDTEIDSHFWRNRLNQAWQLRQHTGLISSGDTNIFRLVHAEGDQLPGLIVDVYDKVAVIQSHNRGIHMLRHTIAEAIMATSDGRILSVFDKSSETLHGEDGTNEHLAGESNVDNQPRENGHPFFVDWKSGQKTGFFIDQRENRKLLAEYANGKKVLNTFSYTGGFSVYALTGGATVVHSVDSSQSAIDGCNKNVALVENGEQRHQSFKADAVQFMKDLPEDYDIIVLDPPAFAKHIKAKHKAVQAYKRLSAHAIRQIKPGGIIFTFSCSQVVDKYLFNHTILAAAITCGRSVRILHQLHQPADHPVNIFHPESEYLKGLVIQVD